jgi:hypothetical protein
MYDNTSLLSFLQSELQQLEVLAGAEDDEARALLQQLEHQMQVLSSPAQQQPLTDLQLAEQIDRFVLVCGGGVAGVGGGADARPEHPECGDSQPQHSSGDAVAR